MVSEAFLGGLQNVLGRLKGFMVKYVCLGVSGCSRGLKGVRRALGSEVF